MTAPNPSQSPAGVHPNPDRTDPGRGNLHRAVVGATVGSIVEWYDVAVYSYLAAVMGKVFFPSGDPTVQLLSSFAAFAVAFLVRPLGGAFFGSLGDRVGRKKTLAVIIILVSVATLLIGFVPSYEQIGVLAPVLLVLLRLVQGFSAGGELTGAAVFVGETAPPRRRGWYVSLVQMGGILGFLLGSLVVLLLNTALSEQAVLDWGWRIPFLLAAPLGGIGLYIRAKLEETPEFESLKAERHVVKSPLLHTFRHSRPAFFVAAAYSLFHNVALYVIVTYVPSHQNTVLKLSSTTASVSALVNMTIICVLIPVFGRLSDRVGRRPVLMAAAVAATVLSYPLFALMASGTVALVIGAHVGLGVILAVFLGATLTALHEQFGPEDRFTGLSTGYNISVSLFGGTAPFFMVLLVSKLHNNSAPGLYVMAAAIVAVLAVWKTRETAPARVEASGEKSVTPSTGPEAG